MSGHPNATRIRALFAALEKGDVATILSVIPKTRPGTFRAGADDSLAITSRRSGPDS